MFQIWKIWRSPARLFLWINLLFIFWTFIRGFAPNAFINESKNNISFYNGQFLTISGSICEEADVNYKSRRLTLCVDGEMPGRVLITTNLYPEYNYGDELKISGQLEAPPEIEGFDYENYLSRYDIYSLMYFPKISPMNNNLSGEEKIFLVLLKLKWNFKSIIDRNLPEPEAGLASALLLGYRRTIMREDLQIFSRVGLSHMIAISGSHITILSAMLINFLLSLGVSRRRALLVVFIFLFIYPLVTGLAASAVRSAIMGALAFLATYYERPSSLVRALIFSGAIMLLFNPKIMRSDIGFQLSFLALLGIIYIYPLGEGITKKYLAKLTLNKQKKKILKTILDTINLTLVSQIISLPISLINFKQFSLIAPLANVLVLWTFPPLLCALILALTLSIIIPALSTLWFLPSYLLLKYIFSVSGILSEPNWAALSINGFGWGQGTIYYLTLLFVVYIIRKRNK